MSTRSGRVRQSLIDTSPSQNRKGVSPTRSPARARKSSPPARASRKSPSRKSPSRKPATNSKFPARKSPSRSVKEIVEADESAAPRSPAKRPAIKSNVQLKQDVSTNNEIYRSTRSKRIEYSVKDLSSSLTSSEFTVSEKVNGSSDVTGFNEFYGLRSRRSLEDAPPRRPSKLRDLIDSVPDIRRSFSKSLSKSSVSQSVSKSLDTFSDEELSEEELQRETQKSRSVTRKLATPLPSSIEALSRVGKFEFGGHIGSVILTVLIPVTVLAILVPCTKSCSYKHLDLSAYKKQSIWFNVESLILLFIHYPVQALFLQIPLFEMKRDKIDETGKKYSFNAFFSALFIVNAIFAFNYFELLNADAILSSYLSLATASYLLGLFLSIIVFMKSRKVYKEDLNPYGNTGYTLYDFFVGREIQPYIKTLNVKLWVNRISNITALTLTILIFKHGLILPETSINTLKWELESIKTIVAKVQFKPTTLVYSLMQMTYILNFIMKEYQITSSFYWQSEGLGYLQIISSALYPFYFTTVSKFIVDADFSLPTNILIASFVLYALGFVMMFVSNNIKYEFRRNPLQSSLANLDSMPTFHGKRLLVSHLWGVLRHPNYTGDILLHVSLALPGILSGQIIAAAPPLITIFMLLHRAWRDHARCKRRYGAAWQRYCTRVPSAIIPKVL